MKKHKICIVGNGLTGLISLKFFIAVSVIIYFTDTNIYAFAVNKESMLSYSLTLIGALIGFLIFNYKSEKKVFLGDFGSLLIGSIITFKSLSSLRGSIKTRQKSSIFCLSKHFK